jgi:hypothetical protein
MLITGNIPFHSLVVLLCLLTNILFRTLTVLLCQHLSMVFLKPAYLCLPESKSLCLHSSFIFGTLAYLCVLARFLLYPHSHLISITLVYPISLPTYILSSCKRLGVVPFCPQSSQKHIKGFFLLVIQSKPSFNVVVDIEVPLPRFINVFCCFILLSNRLGCLSLCFSSASLECFVRLIHSLFISGLVLYLILVLFHILVEHIIIIFAFKSGRGFRRCRGRGGGLEIIGELRSSTQ